MALNYEHYYAIINSNGWCIETRDTSSYILRPDYVPIPEYDENYLMKYYWPIPSNVDSFDDFQGSWYEDAAHTIPWSPA